MKEALVDHRAMAVFVIGDVKLAVTQRIGSISILRLFLSMLYP